MSSGPENRFIKGVHDKFDNLKPHFEKQHNMYRGGTADVWYSGRFADGWIEYKFVSRVPGTGKVVPDLSELQKEWLWSRYQEGRNVFVIVGTTDGGVLFKSPNAWEYGIPVDQFKRALQTKREIAEWISRKFGNAVRKEAGRGGQRRNKHLQDSGDGPADL